MIPTARDIPPTQPSTRQDALYPKRGASNFLYLSLGEWPRRPSTARIGRAQFYRARSASKEGAWPLPRFLLSRLLNGWFEETELPFLSAGQRDGVAFGKAGVAVLARCAGGSVQHAIEAQIGKAVGRDVLPNLFGRVAGGNQFLPGGCIDAVETGRDDRGRADAHMDLSGPGIAKHLHNFTACRSPHQRIIDHDDPFSVQHLRDGIELYLYAEVADRLLRFNEGATDIVISNQSEFELNPRPLGIAERSRHPGVRYGNDDIRRHRRFPRQLSTQGLTRHIDRVRAEDLAVRPGKIHIFKDAHGRTDRRERLVTRHALVIQHHQLAGLDLADNFSSEQIERAGFRGHEVGITQPTETEWPEPMRVAYCNDPFVRLQDDRKRPAYLAQRIDDAGQ